MCCAKLPPLKKGGQGGVRPDGRHHKSVAHQKTPNRPQRNSPTAGSQTRHPLGWVSGKPTRARLAPICVPRLLGASRPNPRIAATVPRVRALWCLRRRCTPSVDANRSIWTALLRRFTPRRKRTPLAGLESNRISRLPLAQRSRESERAAYLQKRDLRGRLARKPAP